MNQNRSKTQKCSNFSTKSVVNCFTRNVVIFNQKCMNKLLIHFWLKKLLHFWVLLRFWFKSYYISGFYYNSSSKVTTSLVLLHFWLFTTFLGLTTVNSDKFETKALLLAEKTEQTLYPARDEFNREETVGVYWIIEWTWFN